MKKRKAYKRKHRFVDAIAMRIVRIDVELQVMRMQLDNIRDALTYIKLQNKPIYFGNIGMNPIQEQIDGH